MTGIYNTVKFVCGAEPGAPSGFLDGVSVTLKLDVNLKSGHRGGKSDLWGPGIHGITEFGGCGLEPATVGGLLSRNV